LSIASLGWSRTTITRTHAESTVIAQQETRPSLHTIPVLQPHHITTALLPHHCQYQNNNPTQPAHTTPHPTNPNHSNTTPTKVCRFAGHQDYIRSAAASPANSDTWLTGSYDHTARLWDVRSGSRSGAAMALDHGAPIEDLAFFPTGGMAVTAGGNTLCIWDVLRCAEVCSQMALH